MNKTDILNKLSGLSSKTTVLAENAMIAVKNHSPEICQIAGGAFVIFGVVMACKATLKLRTAVAVTEIELDTIHATDFESERAKGRQLAKAYTRTGWRFGKLYAPAFAATGTGIFLLCYSSKILQDRYSGMAAAYTMVSNAFNDYRGRVVDSYGKEVDEELRYGIKKEVVKKRIEGEDGKTKTVKETIDVLEGADFSKDDLVFVIGPTLPDGRMDPMYNEDRLYMVNTLQRIESCLTDKLRARSKDYTKKGVVFLNEVYDELCRPRTKAGQILGYVYDPDNESNDANFISFGIRDTRKIEAQEFMDGDRDTIIIELNTPVPVIGNI